MSNKYREIASLYEIENAQKRGYLFEQIIRELQPWDYKPPISAKSRDEQIDAVYQWNGRVFIVEAKAKKATIRLSSHDWEDFELKLRERNKSVIGLFLSLYDVEEKILRQCERLNQEGFYAFVLYGNIWNELTYDPISFSQIIDYLMLTSRVDFRSTIKELNEIKKYYYEIGTIKDRHKDICIKSSNIFLRRYKQNNHENLYVKRSLDKSIEQYLKNIYPKALSKDKVRQSIKNRKDGSHIVSYERTIPAQIIVIRDICGAGKTTFAVENAIQTANYVSFSKSASEKELDLAVENTLSQLGNNYGIVELKAINQPVVVVIDSLDEAIGEKNKHKEISALIRFIDDLNNCANDCGLYAFPIAIIFTVREDYWRDWEYIFEGLRVKTFFKVASEFSTEELDDALIKYQTTFGYSIRNWLSEGSRLTLSNPLNLYIFSETHQYSGEIEVDEVFSSSVLHNYFKNKSEEVYKRSLVHITPRIFLDVCETFLSKCIELNTLNLDAHHFYQCIKEHFPLLSFVADELLRLYNSCHIFHFDEKGELSIRHMKYLPYLYADYMISKCKTISKEESIFFLQQYVGWINQSVFVSLIDVYDIVKYLYSLNKAEKTVQVYLERSDSYMKAQLSYYRNAIAQGYTDRIKNYEQIVNCSGITNARLLVEAFFTCAAKCNNPSKEDLKTLFIKAWKPNKGNPERWKMLPKLDRYHILQEERIMAEMMNSTSWKEWQVFLHYIIIGNGQKRFWDFFESHQDPFVMDLLKSGGEWEHVKYQIMDTMRAANQKVEDFDLLEADSPIAEHCAMQSGLNLSLTMLSNTTVLFGRYRQNQNSEEKSPIEWLVLKREENKALLLSKYALDARAYNDEFSETTWEECTLQKWLNGRRKGNFLQTAFTAEEQELIISTLVNTEANLASGAAYGCDNRNKVFLLSKEEALQLILSDEARQCIPTEYAKEQGTIRPNSDADSLSSCWWWLRSPGIYSHLAACVRLDGSILSKGYNVRHSAGVRPAIWVKL